MTTTPTTPMGKEPVFYRTKEGMSLMEKVWSICGYGVGHMTNPMAQEIVMLVKAYGDKRELEAEVRIHDEYWHSQRFVTENGIGPLSLANKESAQMQLKALKEKTNG